MKTECLRLVLALGSGPFGTNLAPFVSIDMNTDLDGIPMNLENFSLKLDCSSSTAEVFACQFKCNFSFELLRFGFKLKACRCQQFKVLHPF
jgi:hypothetical protein